MTALPCGHCPRRAGVCFVAGRVSSQAAASGRAPSTVEHTLLETLAELVEQPPGD